ncbi:SDR family NAD(P)-dependent oxidoreductase [Streptomyces sp. PAN_FS17]|uniref:SDR family NAD(P)-dependent oxidoreductase n=1 Tax=Streptomyces sp. PAN_FS17 TaxID=1855351 RepID=UPI000895739B|nr:SDR family oxidoreductase [Streptomyces sp. PAN_FS17]SEB85477.1 meso-butanediol dehydrogenase / (S,S)-butanediol dehydrogenase / diacetyl reductase [Streptomyces sp. PAN_FS17]
MSRFDGKVAVITGGGTGIGLATARRLLAESASVVIAGRRKDRLEQAAADMPQDRVLIFPADVSVRAECDALIQASVDRFGRIDTLVNAAGMNLVGTVEQTSDEDWATCVGADLSSVFYTTRAALPHLRATKGSIVNVGSVSSLGGGWSHAGYNAVKAAVANLTRSVACDEGRHGVRANTVCPGLTVTEMVDAIMDDDALLEKAWERIPLRRAAQADEGASAIAYLASDEAAIVTGVALPVDGGQTCTDGGPEWGK